MSILAKARLQRANILKAIAALNDQDASITPELFPKMTYSGELIPVGTRINWNGIVMKAAVDLWDTESNDPENAPSLWEELQYREGHRLIPEVITVTSMFNKDEYGWWNNQLYKSLIDANVYTPDQYAAGWELASTIE